MSSWLKWQQNDKKGCDFQTKSFSLLINIKLNE